MAGMRQALRFFSSAAERQLAIPHISVPDIRSMNWDLLKDAGFKGCVFDKDNTLTLPYNNSVHPSIHDAFEDCKRAFGGKVMIVSNSAGLEAYDPKGEEADAIERDLEIPVLRHRAKKPDGEPEILQEQLGCKTEELVMIGDRVFTDVVYGNRMGMLTVKVESFSSEGEKVTVKFSRWAELKLLKRWGRTVRSPPHRLSQTGPQPWCPQEKFVNEQ